MMRKLLITLLIGWSLFGLLNEAQGQAVDPTATHESTDEHLSISSIAWSPDGSKIAVGYATYVCQPDHPEFYDIQILDAQTGELIRTLAGSYCDITSIDWSPNGAKLAASSLDGIGTWVWDVQSGQLQTRSQEGGQGIAEVRWRPPDGLQLADAAISNGIGILDPMTGAILSLAPIGGTALDWSPDGSKLVSGSGYENLVYVADMVAGQQIMALEGHVAGLTTVAWSPDGTKLASGGGLDDPTIRIWNATTGQNLLVLQGHTIAVSEVVWTPDSSQLASASDDGTVRVWDISTGEQIAIFQYPGRVYAVDWSPDGTRLAYGGADGTLEIVEVNATSKEAEKQRSISSIAWSPDGSMIAVGGGSGRRCIPDSPNLYTVEVIDVVTSQIIHTLFGADCTVMALDWSPDGTKLASASLDAIGIRIWDIATGRILVTKQTTGQGNFDVVWSPDGTRLAITDYGEIVTLLDAATGTVLDEILPGTVVDWNPDGSKLLAGSYGENDVYVADAVPGGQFTILDGHTAPIRVVDWSPDGAKLASGSIDHTVRLWDAATSSLLLILQGHTDFVAEVVWRPDSSQIASASADGTIRVWDAVTGQQMNVIPLALWTSALDWSPDGTRLAYGGADGTLEIVEVLFDSLESE